MKHSSSLFKVYNQKIYHAFKIANPTSRMYSNSIQDIDAKFNNSLALSYLKQKVLFVLGGPGAGKGTQCELLSNEFSMVHLSAGELLRMERLSGTDNGKLIDSYLKEGKIVPVKVTLDLLKSAMQSSQSNRFLVDGFPRNWDNIEGWESCMTTSCDIDAVLFIDCPEKVLEERILSRGLTSGRNDDNLETAKKRFHTFQESTLPILSYYENIKKLVKVRGDRDRNDVFQDIKRVISPFITQDLWKLQYYLLFLTLKRNWLEYSRHCIDEISTCITDDRTGVSNAYNGINSHKTKYFDKELHANYVKLIESDLTIRLDGKNAVSYNQYATSESPIRLYKETRHWKIVDGNWKFTNYTVHIQ